jgi:Flp pilus assembly pilin Flp
MLQGVGRRFVRIETMTKWMKRLRFLRDESGAVTVDWVVLTAALVGLVLMVFTILTEEIYQNTAQSIAAHVDEAAAF